MSPTLTIILLITGWLTVAAATGGTQRGDFFSR